MALTTTGYTSVKKLLFIVLLCLSYNTRAQDIIYTTDKRELVVKVLDITPKTVKYRFWDNANGEVQQIKKVDIAQITYQDGHRETFDQGAHGINRTGVATDESLDMVKQGTEDAQNYYMRYQGASIGTLAVTLAAGGVAGLIPAIACSSTPPREAHLDFPDSTLMENTDYKRAYKVAANKIKQNKTWGAYAWGLTINLVAIAIITYTSRHK